MSNDARRLIDESWQRLQDELASIPEDQLGESGAVGEWSVKDLMAHLAVWDDVAARKAEARATGARLEQTGWQELNDREAAARASWTLDESRREMEAAHNRMLDAFARHPDLELDFWKDDTFEHYREHLDDVRKWREGT